MHVVVQDTAVAQRNYPAGESVVVVENVAIVDVDSLFVDTGMKFCYPAGPISCS